MRTPDINTPDTSPSGNVHGMPLAASLLGLGPEPLSTIFGYSPKVAPENTVLIGIRDVDAAESANIRRAGLARGVHDARHRRTGHARGDGRSAACCRARHCRLPCLASIWTGSRSPKTRRVWALRCAARATYREAHLAMEILADHGRMVSFEIVEVNPVIDEHNRTADLAVQLACSAFGTKIL